MRSRDDRAPPKGRPKWITGEVKSLLEDAIEILGRYSGLALIRDDSVLP